MTAGEKGANADWEKFYKWCQEHQDIPAIDALIGCMSVLGEIDRRCAPKDIKAAAHNVYGYLMEEVERIRGTSK